MSRTGVVVIALSSALVLGSCGSDANWNDLTSRQLYAGWGGLTQEEAVARCDSVSNRELRDYPTGEGPPCSRPTLFAISDLDSDGLDEFWFTVPYMWDTGFQVAELTPDHSDLVMIASACLDCD